jgi:phage gp16-like protein
MRFVNHTAAIHVLKNLLKLQEDDYRALLISLVGKASCKDMTNAQQVVVRTHMDKLAQRMGVQKPGRAAARNGSAGGAVERPQVRKLRAIWWALAEVDAVERPESPADCAKAVEAWAKRQINGAGGTLDALRFASTEQLNKLIEEAKCWGQRVGARIT